MGIIIEPPDLAEEELGQYFAEIEAGTNDPNFTPVHQTIADFDRKLLGMLNQPSSIVSVYTLANARGNGTGWYPNLLSRQGVANKAQLATAWGIEKALIDRATQRLDAVASIVTFLNDDKQQAWGNGIIPEEFI